MVSFGDLNNHLKKLAVFISIVRVGNRIERKLQSAVFETNTVANVFKSLPDTGDYAEERVNHNIFLV